MSISEVIDKNIKRKRELIFFNVETLFHALNINAIGDFSYLFEYERLDENESFMEIREGFGTYGIKKLNNTPFLIVSKEDEVVRYHDFIRTYFES